MGGFRVAFVKEAVGLWHVPEFLPPQDVTIILFADAVIAVVGAGEGDLGQKPVARFPARLVFYVERTIEIRVSRLKVNGTDLFFTAISHDFTGKGGVGEVFDAIIGVLLFQDFDKIGLRQ